jgi:hypothetical protein
VRERHYYDRSTAYPIHPECSTARWGLDDHRRVSAHARRPETHGEGHLPAVEGRQQDLLIMPGSSLPLRGGSSRNELTYYLPAGWDA